MVVLSPEKLKFNPGTFGFVKALGFLIAHVCRLKDRQDRQPKFLRFCQSFTYGIICFSNYG
jgi:hypothetical protein